MEEEEEAEFLRKNIEVQRTIAKIDWEGYIKQS